jgi:hypothetical protein
MLVLAGFAIPNSWAPTDEVNQYGVSLSYRYKRHEKPKWLDVLNAVARACRYPTFLLKGKPEAVVEYLRARKGEGPRSPKLSESYGVFRNRAARRRGPSG